MTDELKRGDRMTDELKRVARAAQKAASAREQLHEAIREASKVASLRDVAAAADLSHEQIRRMTRG